MISGPSSPEVEFWRLQAKAYARHAKRWEQEAWIARGLLAAVIIGNLVLGWL